MTFDTILFKSLLLSLTKNPFFQDFSIYNFDIISSTNQILWNYLKQGKTVPMVAVAEEQTDGRGQWGRVWQSNKGGLYLSLLLPLNLPLNCMAHLTLISGVGIAQQLRQSKIPVYLKWPNDLILKGHKLGGIKTETRIKQNHLTYGVIGVGINWQNAVPSVGINLKSYFEKQSYSTITSLEALAALTVGGILIAYERYQKEGIEPILADYEQLFRQLGKIVTIEGYQGRIIGITPEGELKVRLVSPGAKTDICLSPGRISLGYDEGSSIDYNQ